MMTSAYYTVNGGFQNQATGQESNVIGGMGSTASCLRATVGGGFNRSSTGLNDWRAGSLFETR